MGWAYDEFCGVLFRVCSPLRNGQGVLHAVVVCGYLGTKLVRVQGGLDVQCCMGVLFHRALHNWMLCVSPWQLGVLHAVSRRQGHAVMGCVFRICR